MNKNAIIFSVGFLTGAVSCFAALHLMGDERRRVIFKTAKNTADEKPENVFESPDHYDTEPAVITERISKDEPIDYRAYSESKDSYRSVIVDYTSDDDETDTKPERSEGIYPITPEEFNDMDTYQATTLICYSDGVITDRSDVVIEDVEELLGNWDEQLIGQYEPDAAYIRNDYLMQDFEVLRSESSYKEILAEKPYLKQEDYE